MKGETICSKVVELRVEMNRKAPLSLASDSRELQLQMGPLGVALGPLGGLAVAGWGQDPHRGSPRLGMASVYTKYLSAKAQVGRWGRGNRETTPSLQDPLS